MKLRYPLVFGLIIIGTMAQAELVMELSAPKARYVQHEWLWVTLTFRNTGTQEERLVRSFSPYGDDLSYDITRPDGQRRRWGQPTIATGAGPSDYGKATVCLASGEKYTVGVDLTWESVILEEEREVMLREVLSQPGEYKIRATYAMPGDHPRTFTSNECRLIVAKPSGDDLEAYNLMKKVPMDNEETIWISGRGAYDSLAKVCEDIVARYPDCAYAAYAQLNVAGHYIVRSHDTPETPEDVELAKRGASLFETAGRRLGRSPLAVDAFTHAVRRYRKAGDAEGARRAFEAQLTSTGLTDNERCSLLGYLYVPESGPPVEHPEEVRVSLRPVAESMGFKVMWNPIDKTSDVMNTRVHITVRPEDGWMKDGRMMVPLKVLGPLVADRYGRCRKTGEKY